MAYDLIIIGGGPAGVAAGVYAARKKMKAALITDHIGGQSLVSAEVRNWIGTPAVSGLELGRRLEEHLRAQEGIEIIDGDTAAKVVAAKGSRGFAVTTAGGRALEATALLIATGSRRRRLDVPGGQELEGKGVVYCSTCDAPLFGGKAVAVVGGGNAGLEAAADLLPYASRVYLIELYGSLKGDAVTLEKVRNNPSVEIILNAKVEAVVGEQLVRGLRYRPVAGGPPVEIPVDGVFVEIGIVPNSELVKEIVALNERGEIIVDPKTQATSVPGIWAAGDVSDCLYRQNNVSAGDAVKAVLNICDYIKAI
ncbi:MAG: FAD-dependent oxidoreductase [Candidatus Jorgensenbacteria bacterium]